MEKLLSPPPLETTEQIADSDAGVDASFLMELGIDVGVREATLVELKEVYGARIFRYGQYMGTVADMKASCPAFGETLQQGTAAAMAWLEANDQPEQLLEDDEDLESKNDETKLLDETAQIADEKPQNDEADSHTQPTKAYRPVATPDAHDNTHDTEVIIPNLFVVPESREYTNDVQVIYEPEQVQEAPIATEVDSSIPLPNIEPQETVEDSEARSVHAVATEHADTEVFEVTDHEATMQNDIATGYVMEIRDAKHSAVVPTLHNERENDQPSVVSADAAYEPEFIDESYTVPVVPIGEGEQITIPDAAEYPAETTELNYWHVEEAAHEPEDSVDEVSLGALTEKQEVTTRPRSETERSVVSMREMPTALGEIVAMELEENDTTTREVMGEVTRAMAELTEQPPRGESETNMTAVYHQVAATMHAIEVLEKAHSKEECKVALEELRTKLVELLLQLGYEDAELAAQRMLRQYDIATIKKYIATMMRTFLTVRAKELKPVSLKSTMQMPYHLYGAHAVRMVVNLAA